MNAIESLFGVTEQSNADSVLVYQCDEDVLEPHNVQITRITETISHPLPFADFYFSHALSSAPFFKEEQTSESILFQLRELLRVAKEVRLAPCLLAQEHVLTKLGPVILALQQDSIGIEITPLDVEQFGQSVRLKLWAHECKLS